jgi:hypothetical protein
MGSFRKTGFGVAADSAPLWRFMRCTASLTQKVRLS